jgi:hypothetical protein
VNEKKKQSEKKIESAITLEKQTKRTKRNKKKLKVKMKTEL